jgi:cell wall-associated NlpC family hydrolase
MASGGISGTAVATVTAGAVLVYAGYRGVNPIAALREIASGSPQAVSSEGTTLTGTAAPESSESGSGAALVQAARKHKNEKYSQARRWQTGYSDCSSFVGKAFKDVGITPPGGSTTVSYLAWKQLQKISASEVRAGDLIYHPGHIVIATSNTRAIGQQNRRANVQEGSINVLIPSFPSPTYLRYKGW